MNRIILILGLAYLPFLACKKKPTESTVKATENSQGSTGVIYSLEEKDLNSIICQREAPDCMYRTSQYILSSHHMGVGDSPSQVAQDIRIRSALTSVAFTSTGLSDTLEDRLKAYQQDYQNFVKDYRRYHESLSLPSDLFHELATKEGFDQYNGKILQYIGTMPKGSFNQIADVDRLRLIFDPSVGDAVAEISGAEFKRGFYESHGPAVLEGYYVNQKNLKARGATHLLFKGSNPPSRKKFYKMLAFYFEEDNAKKVALRQGLVDRLVAAARAKNSFRLTGFSTDSLKIEMSNWVDHLAGEFFEQTGEKNFKPGNMGHFYLNNAYEDLDEYAKEYVDERIDSLKNIEFPFSKMSESKVGNITLTLAKDPSKHSFGDFFMVPAPNGEADFHVQAALATPDSVKVKDPYFRSYLEYPVKPEKFLDYMGQWKPDVFGQEPVLMRVDQTRILSMVDRAELDQIISNSNLTLTKKQSGFSLRDRLSKLFCR